MRTLHGVWGDEAAEWDNHHTAIAVAAEKPRRGVVIEVEDVGEHALPAQDGGVDLGKVVAVTAEAAIQRCGQRCLGGLVDVAAAALAADQTRNGGIRTVPGVGEQVVADCCQLAGFD